MIINWLVRSLILLAFLMGSAWGQGMPAALVKVATAEMKNLAPVTLVPGTVISRSDAHLAAEVQGQLIDVAEVGEEFAQGDEVARIDDTRLKLRQQELSAEITRAEARVRFLDSEVKRFERLAESNLAAITQLEGARSDLDVALGDVAVAKARLAQNEDDLARTRIRAPFEGIVVERIRMPGERVAEGDDVVRLVDQDHLEVVARAPLDYYRFTKPGQLIEVRGAGLDTLARVRKVVPVGDEDTHQFEVRLDLEPGVFPVGQTLRVSIPYDEQRAVLTVPRDALVLRPEGQSIFIVDGGNQAQRVEVTTGVGAGEDIEVLGEVAVGDRVIVRGNERLQPGQEVSIIDS
ncbi:MAG: efflux RND transporter periplasmic adaptor subunit [Xanthomonadales bacterium]|nr:efflux RND transporter periplasmic adaptor subunit [Xanthomonadales bacterium]